MMDKDKMEYRIKINSATKISLTINEFKEHGSPRQLLEMYKGNTIVKPYFDYDNKSEFKVEPTAEELDAINKKNILILSKMFPDGDIAISQCHRAYKDGWKVSFHYAINNIKTNVKTLNEFMKSNSDFSVFDKSVYKPAGGLYRCVGSHKDANDKTPLTAITHKDDIEKHLIRYVDESWKEWEVEPPEEVETDNETEFGDEERGALDIKILTKVYKGLDATKLEDYDNWLKVVYVLKNQKSQDSELNKKLKSLVDATCKRMSNYDGEQNNELWYGTDGNNRYGIPTLIELINLAGNKAHLKLLEPRPPEDLIFSDEQELMEHIEDVVKPYVQCVGDRRWFKDKHGMWSHTKIKFEAMVNGLVGKMQLHLEDDKGKLRCVTKSITSKNRLVKDVILNLFNHRESPEFERYLQHNTTNKICWHDGWFDCITNEFHETLDDIDTAVTCGRNYPRTRNPEVYQEIMDKVLNPIFNDDPELIKYFMQIMRKIMSGHKTKTWYHLTGVRNSGKTQIVNLLLQSFGPYVVPMDSKCFIATKRIGAYDPKLLSYVIPHQFARFTACPEIPRSEGKMDGEAIKKFTGNDPYVARVNNCDEITMYHTSTLVFVDNDLPSECTNTDVYQTMKNLTFPCEFCNPEQMKSSVFTPAKKRPADDSVTTFIQRADVKDEFTMMLLYDYDDNIVEPDEVVEFNNDAQEQVDVIAQLHEHIRFVDDSNKSMKPKTLCNHLKHNNITMTWTKLKPYLLQALRDPNNERKPKTWDQGRKVIKYIEFVHDDDEDF